MAVGPAIDILACMQNAPCSLVLHPSEIPRCRPLIPLTLNDKLPWILINFNYRYM